jgi:RNase P/RNase MRP subunit p29
MIAPATLACMIAAASAYGLDVQVLQAIRTVEGGRSGSVSQNTNSTIDIGEFQINSIWLDDIRNAFAFPDRDTTLVVVRDNGCVNALVASAILYKQLRAANGDLYTAIGWYHSRTPHHAERYRRKVLAALPVPVGPRP